MAVIRAVTRCWPSMRIRLPSEVEPSLRFNIRILPRDQVTDREPAQQRVHQVAHLRLAPDKGALDFRNGDLVLVDPCENDGDWVLVYRVFGLGHDLLENLIRSRVSPSITERIS